MFDMEPENSTFVKGTPRRHVVGEMFQHGFRENYHRINIQRERAIGGILRSDEAHLERKYRCASVPEEERGGGREGGITRPCFSRRKNSARR